MASNVQDSSVDGSGLADSATERSFTRRQLRRGLVLLAGFVALRALLWGPFWTQPTVDEPVRYAGLLLVTVLVGSVGLVYLGFTRWVGVDVVDWWVDRDRLLGDVLWGLAGFVVALVVMVGLTLGLQSVVGPPGDAPVAAAPSLVGTLLLYVFGFAVAAFQEETLFRGFLQTALGDRLGEWPAVVGQSAVFSLAHVGYYPPTAWYLFLTAFAGGLVYGWLRKRRDRLLAPGIAHGLVG
jgi:membrane protease YdiL (CAAX protease family)